MPEPMSEEKTMRIAQKVVDDVLNERGYQRGRWSVEHDVLHSQCEWVTILSTWVGKAASVALGGDKSALRKRLVQVAAICMAAIESLDRER